MSTNNCFTSGTSSAAVRSISLLIIAESSLSFATSIALSKFLASSFSFIALFLACLCFSL